MNTIEFQGNPSVAPTSAAPAAAPAAANATDDTLNVMDIPVALVNNSLEIINKYVGVPEWVALHPLLAHYVAEALGTFLFVLTASLVVMNNPIIPDHPESNIDFIPIGFMLMTVVFTFGYVSGGHFNCAVTFSVWLVKKDERLKLTGYFLCQCGGAFGAGLVAMLIEGSDNIAYPHPTGSTGDFIRRTLFAEFLVTFALCLVVLTVAYSTQRGNFFYGFCIGMVVLAGVASVGGISGGAFNPSLATGLQVTQCFMGKCDAVLTLWMYWVAPFIGAALASYIFVNLTLPNGQPVFVDDAPAAAPAPQSPA
jgi:glycerol uptake facilitator-like aquaporin